MTETLADRVAKLVHDRAAAELWKRFGDRRGITEAQLRAEIWDSPEGRALAELAGSPWRNMPATEAEVELIVKSRTDDRWREGLRVLRQGFPP